ncbi:MAG: hypothetical protein QNJ62_13020 [Methyloceanibacter sp.]|nr:hypothetical protein [Methyloceanibacter sp.]
MKQLAQVVAVGVVALSVAGCAVEVPMSAFRVGPLGTEQIPGTEQVLAPHPQAAHNKPASQ